jgi:hypothetical protein
VWKDIGNLDEMGNLQPKPVRLSIAETPLGKGIAQGFARFTAYKLWFDFGAVFVAGLQCSGILF